MENFTKIIRPGSGPKGSVFCKIVFSGGCLSISGVEGPKRNGDAKGSCGQINMHPWDLHKFAPGWDATLVDQFLAVWDRWHLNDMRPGCEHQRAEGWDKRPIDPAKPLQSYGKHFQGQRSCPWNMLGWLTREDHPDGLLSVPCPTCGYKYGSRWMKEDVPEDVLQFLAGLPDADQTPAWV